MISIVIPTYEMHGRGVEFLTDLIVSISKQDYKDYEIIISDDSDNDSIEYWCAAAGINYHRNPGTKGAAYNLNNAISHAKGDIIKPMFQDDQFLDNDCLTKIAAMEKYWCVCTSAHLGSDRGDHVPYDPPNAYELARGCNTYGSPSAMAYRAGGFQFDTNLQWLFDCDFYARMLQISKPEYIPAKVLIREWDGMATRTNAMGMVRVTELEYIENKYANLR